MHEKRKADSLSKPAENTQSIHLKLTTYQRFPKKKEKIFHIGTSVDDSAIESDTHIKYHISDDSKFFEAENDPHVKMNKELLIEPNDLQLYIELASLGGNYFRLLMGKKQPKFYTTSSVNNNNNNTNEKFYRTSVYIEGMQEDNVFTNASVNTSILKNLFEAHPDLKISQKPIVGSISQIVFSFFLGDSDYKNIGTIPDNDITRVIRFDPEFCFFTDFWNNDVNYVLTCLNVLSKPDIRFDDLKNADNLSDTLFFDQLIQAAEFNLDEDKYPINDDSYNKSIEGFKSLFYSTWKQFEAYAAIARILEIPQWCYEKLIDKNISYQYNEFRSQLKKQIKKRLNVFELAANKLPCFQEFRKKYTQNTAISGFWHAFFGDRITGPKKYAGETPAYTCYAPIYLNEKETPDTLRERLNKTATELLPQHFKPIEYEPPAASTVGTNEIQSSLHEKLKKSGTMQPSTKKLKQNKTDDMAKERVPNSQLFFQPEHKAPSPQPNVHKEVPSSGYLAILKGR